jgi:plasmid stability protein
LSTKTGRFLTSLVLAKGAAEVISSDIEGGTVTDILIRNVPEDVIAAIDIKAHRLGLSRTEYLRRTLTRESDVAPAEVSVSDLAAFADTFADLADPEVIDRAWR